MAGNWNLKGVDKDIQRSASYKTKTVVFNNMVITIHHQSSSVLISCPFRPCDSFEPWYCQLKQDMAQNPVRKGKQRSKRLCNDPFCARDQHLSLDSLVGIESWRIDFVFALSGMRLEASFPWRQSVRFSAVTNYRSWIERSACLGVAFPKAEHRSAHGRRLSVSSGV